MDRVDVACVTRALGTVDQVHGPILNPWNCLTFLRQATNLVECTLHFIDGWEDGRGVDISPISPPSLQALRLVEGGYGNSPLNGLLPLLMLPALQDLEVTRAADLDADLYVSFLCRNSARLQSLAREVVPGEYFHSMPELNCVTSQVGTRKWNSCAIFANNCLTATPKCAPQVEHILCFIDSYMPTHIRTAS
ncbi:hypothetical protein B0H10DRAFT_2040272 [Mycena sp. CBHHK59/15]|nr:hypothetical protein B0H10DRAFT_2040272 [Mycena sp. CBHHK59/15]